MKNALIFSFLLCLSSVLFGQAADPALAYIEQFKQLAMDEQNRVGIPASITLAQGLYESANGTSYLAVEGRNHFGIKCKKEWTGETILHTDDAPNECFRKYPSANESYLDHSNYLKNNRRYAFLFDIDKNDYEGWAVGLKKAGYATNPKYAYKLIDIIKKYELHQYTVAASRAKNIENKVNSMQEIGTAGDNKDANPISSEYGAENTRIIKNETENDLGYSIKNNLKGFYVKKGESILEHASKRNIRYTKLLLINDLIDGPAPEDMFIYVEKKSKQGLKPYHTVRDNESLLGIAQAEGIQLTSLRDLNLLNNDEMPRTGETLNLIEKRENKPLLVGASGITTNTNETKPVEPTQKEIDDANIAGELSVLPKRNSSPKERQINKTDKENISGEDLINDPTRVDEPKARNKQKTEVEPQVEDSPALVDNSNKSNIENNEAQTQIAVPKEAEASVKTEDKPAALPVLKSPSTYDEPGLSDDIKKLKKEMDKLVYAAPPAPKPKKVETAPKPDTKNTIKPATNDSLKNKTNKAAKTVTPTTTKPTAAKAVSTGTKPAKTADSVKTTVATAPKMVAAPAKKPAPKTTTTENKPADINETKKAPKMIAAPVKKKPQ